MEYKYPLSSDAILHEASHRTGGLTDTGSGEFLQSLDRLIDSLNTEARLNEMGVVVATERLLQHVTNRMLYLRDRKENPTIADEKIVKPVFIIGMPRTGTTILHDILAMDPSSRAPLTWEMNFPSPPPEKDTFTTDPRIAQCEALFPQDEQAEKFKAVHPMGAQLTQECIVMMADTMCSAIFHNQFRVPSYQDFVDGQDAPWADVYDFHKKQLQHLQWKCKGDRWVLKTGAHLWSLEYLLAEYPDARIVFNHRDPVKSMTSYASLTHQVRVLCSDEVDPVEIADDWIPRLCRVLHHGLDVRLKNEYPEARFYDMYFDDFCADQFGEIQKVYEAFDIPLSAEAERAMRKFIGDNPKGVHGTHEYREEDYGIDAEEIRDIFSRYIEHFNLSKN